MPGSPHETLDRHETLGWGIPSRNIATHYELLGVSATATADEIREAYRARARTHHPDQAGANGSDASMAAINEAYRVLRDPASRSRYDAEVHVRHVSARSTARAHRGTAPPPEFTAPRADPTPARYPWKLVVGMAAVGATVVLVGAALYEPAEPAGPDNVLRTGSCVALEANNDVREVDCTGTGDLVVDTVVAFGQRCPGGLAAHRDRQGMGIACVARDDPTP